MNIFSKIKNKLNKWAEKEAKELDNCAMKKYRKQMKKDCPELFKGFNHE